MCGIAGFIGKKCAESELIQSLKYLEYRGYDSAGIAVLNKNKISTIKCTGKIVELEKQISSNNSTCGIAHTRWATHGLPKKENAHPHMSNDNSWAVVHNGIIENYSTFKKQLTEKGFEFKSQTDSEVIANLLEVNETNSQIQTLINT